MLDGIECTEPLTENIKKSSGPNLENYSSTRYWLKTSKLVLHLKIMKLINPSKSDIWKFIKNSLDRINILSSTPVKQRKNSRYVIDWFENITNKQSNRFTLFPTEHIFILFISQNNYMLNPRKM